MKNRNLKILFLTITFLILTLIVYIVYYVFFLKDEYYSYSINSIFSTSTNTVLTGEIFIYNYKEDSCEVSYCIYNECNNALTLPCREIALNEFEEDAFYEIQLNFSYYNVLPIGKRFLNDIYISRSKFKSLPSKDSYISGVKKLLNDFTIRRAYSCFIPMDNLHEDFYCEKDLTLENNYLQSIYLTYILGEKIGDRELIEYAQDEIFYLNTNKDTILNGVIKYPEAYILKLVELGLDMGYLEIIDNFNIPTYEAEELRYKDETPILSTEEKSYIKNDRTLFLYSDYALLFKEYNRIDLANYFKYELIHYYNALQYDLYPLCTIANTYSDERLDSYLEEKFETAISESNNLLLLNSFQELLKCKEYFKKKDIDVRNLNISFDDILRKSTIEFEGNSYLVDASYSCSEESAECENIRLDFDLLTNLKYILYE